MPVITALTPDSRRPSRIAVLVDGAPIATVSFEIIERLGLRVGLAVDDGLREAVKDAAEALRVYDRAANMLAARGRSAAELRRLLVRKGEPAQHVDAAIERLVAQGYLDDAEFARQFARSKAMGAGHARFRLRQELARRGVARATADEAIDTVFADESVDEGAIVVELARKKLRSLGGVDVPTRRRRLYGFLSRRGYDPDAIRRALDEVLLDAGGDGASA